MTCLLVVGRPVVLGVSRIGPDCPALGGEAGGDDLGVMNSGVAGELPRGAPSTPVSYTHLTLPTKRIV